MFYHWISKLKRLQPHVPLFFAIENGPHVLDEEHGIEGMLVVKAVESV